MSEPSEEDYEQCLLRMLHCYILPKITLHIDDLDKVVKAREKQALNIQALDMKVIDECKTIDACESRMEDLRTQFLPSLERFVNKGRCSKGFLDLLLEDISKEEPKLRQQVRGRFKHEDVVHVLSFIIQTLTKHQDFSSGENVVSSEDMIFIFKVLL